jgi:hypothetical protein
MLYKCMHQVQLYIFHCISFLILGCEPICIEIEGKESHEVRCINEAVVSPIAYLYVQTIRSLSISTKLRDWERKPPRRTRSATREATEAYHRRHPTSSVPAPRRCRRGWTEARSGPRMVAAGPLSPKTLKP